MVTGIEQYHFERAGYFVRRSLVGPDALAALRAADPLDPPPAATAVAAGLLGVAAPADLAAARRAGEWHRAIGPGVGAPEAGQVARLARCGGCVEVCIALAPVSALTVLPGSHAEPPVGPVLDALREGVADIPEVVRVRLQPGDAVAMSAALLRWIDAMPDASDALRWFAYRGPEALPDA